MFALKHKETGEFAVFVIHLMVMMNFLLQLNLRLKRENTQIICGL